MHPLRRQTNSSINKLLDELEKLDLTKAERLQILNLAPTTLVALVVVSLVLPARSQRFVLTSHSFRSASMILRSVFKPPRSKSTSSRW